MMNLKFLFRNKFNSTPTPDHPLVRPRDFKLARRVPFIDHLDRDLKFLEVGPYFTPELTGLNVRYFDVFTTDELKERARIDPLDYVKPENVPVIHYTDPDGMMASIDEEFDAVYSSHNIEHQPDLVRHLNEVHDLLKPGGRFYLLAPDKRYCFDHYRPVSTLGGVLQAAREERRRHSAQTVIDQLSMITHNDQKNHWLGQHEDPAQKETQAQRAQKAIQVLNASDGSYFDAHAWQFTPLSFAQITEAVYACGLTALKPVCVHDTPIYSHEFTAIFERPA